MSDEKQVILEMLKEGKITVEEANELLEAVGSSKNGRKTDSDILTKISSTLDTVVKKTTEAIQNFDIDNLDINQYNIKGEVNTHKEIRIDDDINDIAVDLVNGKISIERADDSAISIEEDIWSKKGDLTDFIEVEIDGDRLTIEQNEDYKNLDASVELKIYLAKNLYESLSLDIVNGNIDIEGVDFADCNIDSVNGKIVIVKSQGDFAIDNVNGKVDLANLHGNVKVNNVNGNIRLGNVSGTATDVSTVNGTIRVDESAVDSLKIASTSGSIKILEIKDGKEIEIDSTFGPLTVDTDGFDKGIRAVVETGRLNIADKYINKTQKDGVYEISTTEGEADLEIRAKAGFGKANFR